MREPADHTLHTTGRARPAAGAAALTALALLLAGCGGDGGSDASPSSTATRAATTSTSTSTSTDAAPADTTTEPDGEDAAPDAGCPDTDAVADVVGAPVDASSSGGGRSGDGPTWSFQGCAYDLEDGDGDVGIARITVDRSTVPDEDAARTDFALLDATAELAFATDGFEPVADLGDDAYRDGRDIAVRHGEQLFLVGIESPDGRFADGGDQQSTDARAVAVEVLDVDLSVDADRLCEPLQGAVVAALGEAVGSQARSGSVGVDEVSFETRGCAVTLADGREVEVDVADADVWEDWARAKAASGLGETYRALTLGERAAFETGDGLVVDDGDQPLLVTSEDLDLEPDEETDLRIALAELALGT